MKRLLSLHIAWKYSMEVVQAIEQNQCVSTRDLGLDLERGLWQISMYMNNYINPREGYPDDLFSALMELTKANGAITQMQQDIVETMKVLSKPFDKHSAEKRIMLNHENHRDIFSSWELAPLISQNMLPTETANAYGAYLFSQLYTMMTKEFIGDH